MCDCAFPLTSNSDAAKEFKPFLSLPRAFHAGDLNHHHHHYHDHHHHHHQHQHLAAETSVNHEEMSCATTAECASDDCTATEATDWFVMCPPITCHTSHVTRHTSHVTRCTGHTWPLGTSDHCKWRPHLLSLPLLKHSKHSSSRDLAAQCGSCYTSHVTRHTSHVTILR